MRTAHASTPTTPCVPALLEKVLGLEIVSAKHLCANVTTGVAPGSLAATASIEQITVALGGLLPTIRLTGLTAYAESGCDGASGHGSVATLSIGGASIPASPAPNTTIGLPLGGRITLDEQVPAAAADHGLTVRAAHIVVPGCQMTRPAGAAWLAALALGLAVGAARRRRRA